MHSYRKENPEIKLETNSLFPTLFSFDGTGCQSRYGLFFNGSSLYPSFYHRGIDENDNGSLGYDDSLAGIDLCQFSPLIHTAFNDGE